VGTKIYTDQPLNVPMTFTDQDGAIINITGGTVALHLYGPDNSTETADSVVTGSLVVPAAGTATALIPSGTLKAGQWRLQPVVTLSAIPWPGEVTVITVLPRGKA
jgi:hypothetical protein